MKIPEHCFECGSGRYEVVETDYQDTGSDGTTVVVPKVKILRCTACGEELIPAESDRYISRFVAEANDQLTKAQLFDLFHASGLNQMEFAEAIGLGEKTFHRWLKGTQVVSRSMGYYLRALQAFPEVFQWVRERRWRVPTRPMAQRMTTGDESARFPALAEASRDLPSSCRTNPARGLTAVCVAGHRN